jgi:hypothetical protein
MKGTVILAVALAVLAAATAAPAQAGLSPQELLERYQPVTVLDAREAFAPAPVDGFVADSDLELLGDDGLYHHVDPSPAGDSGLPVHGDGWRLNQRFCSPVGGLASVACYAASAAAHGPRSVVYGRYEVRAGTIVLQYWLFYEDNFWSLFYPPNDLVW